MINDNWCVDYPGLKKRQYSPRIRVLCLAVACILTSTALTFWRRNYFFNFSTPCLQNVSNTGTKQVKIMKKTVFWREKRRVYTMFKIFFTYICWIYKMLIIQEPNTLELWKKLHFEKEKTESIYCVRIFGSYICWINI